MKAARDVSEGQEDHPSLPHYKQGNSPVFHLILHISYAEE